MLNLLFLERFSKERDFAMLNLLFLERFSKERVSAMLNFGERLKTLRTGLSLQPISRTCPMRRAFWDGCKRFFALLAVLASTLDTRAKTISQRRLFPVSLIYPVLATLSVCFSWVMFSCQDVTDHCTLAGSADSPFFVCRDHSTPPLLGSKHGMESLGFSSSYAENFWVLTRGANNTN